MQQVTIVWCTPGKRGRVQLDDGGEDGLSRKLTAGDGGCVLTVVVLMVAVMVNGGGDMMVSCSGDPDFGVDDEVDDLLSSGVEDSDGDDSEDGNDGEDGEGGDGGVGHVNQNQGDEPPVNTEGDQEPEVRVENVIPKVNEPAVVNDSDHGENEDSHVIVIEPEQVQNETIDYSRSISNINRNFK
ncbi:hypothetical protein L1987_45801 [Smallanthus sonchifolius]|uniref:Uncharacterized protein n=1 Tax=Smallanthus sonchifolius TaxID=185202 RepID=A0ACB9FYZ6_9ASTR|nr:hypothetical protein L1987_45801 [Smallanthus sonchifolius]